MTKGELNSFAISLAKNEFLRRGYAIEESPASLGEVNFLAIPTQGTTKKIKVRSASHLSSYIFVTKDRFNIDDSDLYLAVVYVFDNDPKDAKLYVIPATEWRKNIYPFISRDYNKKGQISKPEWGISPSQKGIDAMESYRGLQKLLI